MWIILHTATGCMELGYTDGCCVFDYGVEECNLDLPGAEDCYCDEACYQFGGCCPDILSTCPPREKRCHLHFLDTAGYVQMMSVLPSGLTIFLQLMISTCVSFSVAMSVILRLSVCLWEMIQQTVPHTSVFVMKD